MGTFAIELDKRKQETTYINAIISNSYRALTRELNDSKKIAEKVLFCTPEEAESVVLQNTSFEQVKCKIDDRGHATFQVRAKLEPRRNLVHNTYGGTSLKHKINNVQYGTGPSITVDSGTGPSVGTYMTYNNSTSVNITSGSVTTGTLTTTNSMYSSPISFQVDTCVDTQFLTAAMSKLKISKGDDIEILLPNGAILQVNTDGSYTIKDDDAKVVYQANPDREFNRFINSSDLLQDFIRFLGEFGVKQGQVLNIPIELFINWLVAKAAEKDGEEIPEEITPPEVHPRLIEAREKQKAPKCLWCGKFVRKMLVKKGFNFCGGTHASRFADKLELAS